MGKPKECTDWLGNTFPSITAMCDYHGVDSYIYYSRLRKGFTNKEALTGVREIVKVKVKRESRKSYDHLGNCFENTEAKCAYYGISAPTYYTRKHNGLSEELALTKPIKSCHHKRRIT